MPSVTYNFLPEGGTLASGVRAPTALTQGGVSSYINLDPEAVTNDVDYAADALPASASPAWTKTGTEAESVASSILSLVDDSAAQAVFYDRTESSLATGTRAYLACRAQINSYVGQSGLPTSRFGGLFLWIYDGTKNAIVHVNTDGGYLMDPATGAVHAGSDFTPTSGYHVWELHKVNSTAWRLYYDGRLLGSAAYSEFPASATKAFSFGSGYGSQVNCDIDWIRYKISTLLPATSPTADFAFDSGVAGTVWDMSTILMLENLFGEAGSVKYKYAAGETTTPTLSGAFQTAAQLTSESDPTGRYFRLNVQLNGDGSQDAGWGGMQIVATVKTRIGARGTMRGA